MKLTKNKDINTSKGCCIILFAIIGIITVSVILSDSSTPKTKIDTEEDKKITASVCAKFEIKRLLKAPSTAKFPWLMSTAVYKNGSNFVVDSYVDAQNSFGATIRNSFKCIVHNPIPGTGTCYSTDCIIY